MDLKEYNTKFLEYYRLVPLLVTLEYNKVTRYIYGLPKEIHDQVRWHMPATTESVIELAGYLMESCGKKFERGKEGSAVFNRPMPGHKEEECRKKLIVCFDCGEKGHFSAECTKKKPVAGGASGSGARNDGKKGNSRVFMLNTQKVGEFPDVITGTFPINNVYARVLFDLGANQSFIDYKFCSLLNEPLAKLNNHYEVETANGNLIRISEMLNSYISLAMYDMPVQLLPIELAGFDVILGMDWLSANQARFYVMRKL
ncbi:uncharacterized protein LOC143546030 [Bidens hawaiensis]|uniref:uncharacterized protein LOC143546030 n=1 Tax=Bidens hawaiensis TaxID=980011 RepID=UPI00404AC3E0